MVYLESFTFPTPDTEQNFFMGAAQRLNVYSSTYPFQILAPKGFRRIDFEPLTILSGSNGSGKSTALSVIAEKLKATRSAPFNSTPLYGAYVKLCEATGTDETPSVCRLLTSDDVFDYMLDIRNINRGVDTHREEVFEEYTDLKSERYSDFTMKTMEDYDTLKKLVDARRLTKSTYTRENTPENIRTHSNGETALKFFIENIFEGGLYLLDEPENSLSPAKQLELAAFLEDSARYFNCQLVISTHSVFLLGMKGAKIYDLDVIPVDVRPWTELGVSKVYHDYFQSRKNEF